MKHYSSNNEIFNFDSIEEAVQNLIESDGEIKAGDVVEVYEADQDPVNESDFVPYVADHMRENAYDTFGELAGDFPDMTSEQEAQLQEVVEKTVMDFLEKNKLLASFYRVKNVKTINIKITALNEFDCEWEMVS